MATGGGGLIRHSTEPSIDWWGFGSGVIAFLGAILLLAGYAWSRWILVTWLGFHAVLGFLHDAARGAVHGLLFVSLTYALLRPGTGAAFQNKGGLGRSQP